MSHNITTTRRHFFFGYLLSCAVPLGGFGTVPSLKAMGYKAYSDKLRVASIGCGGQGGVILNQAAQTETIVALCDVDDKLAAANFAKFSSLPKYKDFRVMLDKEGKPSRNYNHRCRAQAGPSLLRRRQLIRCLPG